MTALLVILTIVVLVSIDFGKIRYHAYKMHKAEARYEQGLGYCMADGENKDE